MFFEGTNRFNATVSTFWDPYLERVVELVEQRCVGCRGLQSPLTVIERV